MYQTVKSCREIKGVMFPPGSVYGCMFYKQKIHHNGICKLNDNPPFKWDLNDLEKWLSEHNTGRN